MEVTQPGTHFLGHIICNIQIKIILTFPLAGVELMVLSGGQVVLAYIIILLCFALAMAVLCGEVIVEKAHRNVID